MESILANLFLTIQEKIAALSVGETEAKAFRLVNHDLGQLDDERPALSYPAILIDMGDFAWSPIGANCQVGEGRITIKVVFNALSDTSSLTPEEFREKGLQYYELEHLLKNALDGWCPDPEGDAYSPMVYESVQNDKSRTDLRIRVLTFSIGIDDYTNKETLTETPVTPDFCTKFTNP